MSSISRACGKSFSASAKRRRTWGPAGGELEAWPVSCGLPPGCLVGCQHVGDNDAVVCPDEVEHRLSTLVATDFVGYGVNRGQSP